MSFDFDLFVIGAGSGGVRAARFAAGFGARVAVAESRYLGGTCVNVGCVPKKLLVYGAHFSEDFEQARAYGWSAGEAQFDWATLIGNKNREIQRLNGIYRNLLVNSGVTLLEGHARLLDAHSVEVDGQRFSAKHILVATGGWPQVPDIPGKEHAITSNEAFFLERLPRRVLVVGGGYIAVEFASIFNGLGAETTLLYRRDLFLRGFDRSVREHLRDELGKKGLDLQFNSDIARIDKQADGSLAATLKDGRVLEADCVFYATGRRPMLDDLGLENTAVKLTDKGFIAVDEHWLADAGTDLAGMGRELQADGEHGDQRAQLLRDHAGAVLAEAGEGQQQADLVVLAVGANPLRGEGLHGEQVEHPAQQVRIGHALDMEDRQGLGICAGGFPDVRADHLAFFAVRVFGQEKGGEG